MISGFRGAVIYWKGCWRKRSWRVLRYYSGAWAEILVRTTSYLSACITEWY